MTEEEIKAAANVVLWYEGVYAGGEGIMRQDLADAVWYALEEQFGRDMAVGAASKSRITKYIDARMAMYKYVAEKFPSIPKCRIASYLGMDKEHATVLNALKKADDLLEYDVAFRGFYSRLSAAVNAKLDAIVRQRNLDVGDSPD